jgi:predicted RNase H-like nuclease
MNVVGVDSCKWGGFAVALDADKNWAIGIYKSMDVQWNAVQPLSMMFIDIPIGLPQSRVRESHPELYLWALAGKQIMGHLKNRTGFCQTLLNFAKELRMSNWKSI